MHIFIVTDDRFVACCVIKIENKLKYNFSRSVYWLEDENVTGISTKLLLSFQMLKLLRVNFSHRSQELVGVLGAFQIIKGLRNWW